MNILAWNYCGSGKRTVICEIQIHYHVFEPDISFISETKVHNTKDLGRFDILNFNYLSRFCLKVKAVGFCYVGPEVLKLTCSLLVSDVIWLCWIASLETNMLTSYEWWDLAMLDRYF